MLDSGTIVAADCHREEHLSILLPTLTCKFEKGCKNIRKEQRQLNAELVRKDKDDALALETVSSQVIEHGLSGQLGRFSSKDVLFDAFRDDGPGVNGGHRCSPCHVASFKPPLIDFVAVSWQTWETMKSLANSDMLDTSTVPLPNMYFLQNFTNE